MIFDKPDDFIKVRDRQYKINTDFKLWAAFGQSITDAKDDKNEIFKAIYNMIFSLNLPLKTESVQGVISFLNGRKSQSEKIDKTDKAHQSKAFDFIKDEGLIIAAFKAQYNIDLTVADMHWWTFLDLFAGLNDEQIISKIISIRTIDTSKMCKEQKAFYTKLKRKFSLDDNCKKYGTVQERDNALKEKIKQIQREVNGNG